MLSVKRDANPRLGLQILMSTKPAKPFAIWDTLNDLTSSEVPKPPTETKSFEPLVQTANNLEFGKLAAKDWPG